MAFDPERDEFLQTIKTQDDFLSFLEWFAKDFREDDGSWQNHELDDFLRAIASWLKDKNGSNATSDRADWCRIAELLYVGKTYE